MGHIEHFWQSSTGIVRLSGEISVMICAGFGRPGASFFGYFFYQKRE
ncbi:hypothetical protein ART_0423 [Arthrobacter sp. PAMC 25486]|nr:hypothetical protein ART_0423 [Arthrobacter sp. PAMC 25486]